MNSVEIESTEKTLFPVVIQETVEAAVPVAFSFLGSMRTIQPTQLQEKTDGLFSVISFLGQQNWSFTLILPRKLCDEFVKRFCGFEFPYDSADIADVVGEIANVLAGEISAQAFQRGIEARMSLPTVARGSDLELLMPEGLPSKRILYSTDIGIFGFKLMMAKPTPNWLKKVVVAKQG